MSNQEAHKYLRQNKPGIRHSEIAAQPKDYVRPRGFQVVPGLIGRGGKQPGPSPNQTASYYEALQEEMSRYVTHSLIYSQWCFDFYNACKFYEVAIIIHILSKTDKLLCPVLQLVTLQFYIFFSLTKRLLNIIHFAQV
jgi:hypothetical protein